MANPLYSNYLWDPVHWDAPDPDYTTVRTLLSHRATTQPAAMQGLINVSLRSPLAVARIIHRSNEDHIHIGHLPSLYPTEPGTTTPFDNHVVVLMGDTASSAVPVFLQDTAFSFTTAL